MRGGGEGGEGAGAFNTFLKEVGTFANIWKIQLAQSFFLAYFSHMTWGREPLWSKKTPEKMHSVLQWVWNCNWTPASTEQGYKRREQQQHRILTLVLSTALGTATAEPEKLLSSTSKVLTYLVQSSG